MHEKKYFNVLTLNSKLVKFLSKQNYYYIENMLVILLRSYEMY